MKAKDVKGEVQIIKWEIDKMNELDSRVIITMDKENVSKLLYGLIGLTKGNDTFFIGFNLSNFGAFFERRKVKEEVKQN